MAPKTDVTPPIASWLELVRKSDPDLLKLCRLDTFRGSGRGGQKRNKTSNAVRLTLGEIAVTESASRSRSQNISNALEKLRLSMALSLPPAINRHRTGPSFPREVQPYLSGGVIRISPKNPLFPIFIGCLVDLFIENAGNIGDVAKICEVSNSQLRRFIEKHPVLAMTLGRIRPEPEESAEKA